MHNIVYCTTYSIISRATENRLTTSLEPSLSPSFFFLLCIKQAFFCRIASSAAMPLDKSLPKASKICTPKQIP